VDPFLTVFYTLTPRAEEVLYFDWRLDELLQGKTWGEDEKTNKWILWRLYFAHRCAFEMQAAINEEAVRTGTRRVCKPGNVKVFRPDRLWHAGMEGLHESKQPEVLLVLEYALAPIAEHFETHFNATGGFGQHAWTPAIARSQLAEVKRIHISEVSVSLGWSLKTLTQPQVSSKVVVPSNASEERKVHI
jgi:hypothetical protein